MKYEYRTTHGDTVYNDFSRESCGPSDPDPPAGDGWEMSGMAANDRHIFWSWRRLVPRLLQKKYFFIDTSGSMTKWHLVNAVCCIAARRDEVEQVLIFNQDEVRRLNLDRLAADPVGEIDAAGLVRGPNICLPQKFEVPPGFKTVFITDGEVARQTLAAFDEVIKVTG